MKSDHEVRLQCADEAEVFFRLNTVLVQLGQCGLQRVDGSSVGALHHLQDPCHHGLLQLLTQSTQDGRALLPKCSLR